MVRNVLLVIQTDKVLGLCIVGAAYYCMAPAVVQLLVTLFVFLVLLLHLCVLLLVCVSVGFVPGLSLLVSAAVFLHVFVSLGLTYFTLFCIF